MKRDQCHSEIHHGTGRISGCGFFAFIAGGGLCAALTHTLVMRGKITYLFPFFTTFEVVEGLVFWLILFGTRLRPRSVA
jgi:hypothetical protein